ncbi:hypothetical protein DL98DRAFT_581868 [Cadophora sp. DSE1049]|nr:hypothetical protein DL98DRAFT_581868 [Cadophora sp. DSE1049]
MANTNFALRFRQNALAWLSSFVSLLLLVLIVMYALRSYSMSNYQSVRSSSSRTILVLRVLSELTSILMVIMLALTMENVKWRFITRKQGQQLKNFLTLVAGTSMLGLLQLLFGKGLLFSSWRFSSLLRLVLIALPPVLNVVLFSNINTQLSYHTDAAITGPFDGAMGDFNASIATSFALMIDSITGVGFADLLSDPRRALDIGPQAKNNLPCSLGVSKTDNQTCNQVFFMPGLVLDLDQLRNAAHPEADLFVVNNSPGYMLNFTTSGVDVPFNLTKDCRVYGNEMAAFEICIRENDETLKIKINQCLKLPSVGEPNCLANREWQSSPGSTTSASISLRNATIGFSRLNSTIRTHHLADHWTTLEIGASDLLIAFDGFFEGVDSTEIDDLANEFINSFNAATGQNIKFAPVIIASYLEISDQLYGSAAAQSRNAIALQSLLAFALFYCSFAPFKILPSIGADPASFNGTSVDVLGIAFNNSPNLTYYLASTTYELVVGFVTIWVYTALGGLLILLSWIGLCICTFTEGGVPRPVTTAFADIDHRLVNINDFEHNADAGRVNAWTDQPRVVLRE